MKRILFALSLILSLTMVSAQPKNAADAIKAVDKAKAAAADEKKAAKPDTWVKLAKAYIDAYELPTRNILVGTPQTEVKLFLKDQRVLGTEQKEGAEAVYNVDIYADKELYYNEAGILDFYLVTKPVLEGDVLNEAVKALEKAKELDPKGSKEKDITEMMKGINDKYSNEGLYEYYAGHFDKAAELFKKAANAMASPVLGQTDSLNIYYTALVSNLAGNKDQAIEYYKKCLDMKFYQKGNTFSNLADIYRQMGDTAACKETLENGFVLFPENNGILIGLINLYMDNNESPDKLFELLHTAQSLDPENPSLFSAEGNLYKKLGDTENAARMFKKSAEVNPDFVFAPLSLGVLYYDKAIDVQTKATEEFDEDKYQALIKELDETLEKAIDPFETAFAKTDDPELKGAIAEYLKNIYFRLREKNPEYETLFKKYDAYLKGE